MPPSLLIATLLILPLSLRADGPPLRLGTTAVAPYGYLDAAGKPDGAFYHLLNRVAERAGLDHSNAIYPTARLYALLQRRQVDLAISSIKLDRDMGLVDIGRIWQLDGVILYRKQTAIAPRTIEDFKPYQIGRLNGTCPTLQRDGFKLYDLSDYAQGLRMLAAGRLGGLCGEFGGLSAAQRTEPGSTELFAPPFVFLSTEVHLYANPQLPTTVHAKLTNTTSKLIREGEAQAIISRYTTPTKPTP